MSGNSWRDFFETPRTPRPKLRRKPLPEPCIYTLRIDLLNAKPPIWRRIEVRSDVSLQTLHIIIQAAFDWFDYHLYQFALGEPFDYRSELFLCDYDAEEDPEEGLSVRQVRLDETLQEPRDLYLHTYTITAITGACGSGWRRCGRQAQVIPPHGVSMAGVPLHLRIVAR